MTTRQRLLTAIIILTAMFTVSCATTSQQINKEQGNSIRNIGEVYMKQGNYRKALKEFQQARALYPDDHLLHYDFGIAYFNLNRLALSVEHFKKALALKPDFAAPRNNRGIAYFRQKKLKKETPSLQQKVLTLQPAPGRLYSPILIERQTPQKFRQKRRTQVFP